MATAGSSSLAVYLVGSTISSTRTFGVGNSTSKLSMCASRPHSLNRARIHSALSLSYADPTWCGRALIRRMYSRRFAGSGIARNFSSHWRSDLLEEDEYPTSVESSAANETEGKTRATVNNTAAKRRMRILSWVFVEANYSLCRNCGENEQPGTRHVTVRM